METKKDIAKRLKLLAIIFLILIFPGLLKTFGANAFEQVKFIDIALLFMSGVLAGAFIVVFKIYLQFRKEE